MHYTYFYMHIQAAWCNPRSDYRSTDSQNGVTVAIALARVLGCSVEDLMQRV